LAVAPDTHSVYPQHLPAGVKHVEQRPVRQLIDRVGGGPVFYPLEELIARGESEQVFLRTDSHWTDHGAYTFYALLMERLAQDLPVRVVQPDDLRFTQVEMSGDLGSQLVPTRFEQHRVARVAQPRARPLYDNCVSGNGAVIITSCADAPDTTCLLFGDSYAYALLKFLPESFRRLVFVHRPTLVPEVLDAQRAHVVISLMAERFLVRVPVDDVPDQLRTAEREKRAMGRTRMPMTAFGMTRSYASVGRVEAMRARMTAQSGSLRDATIVSLMAYAGLGAAALGELRWADVSRLQLWDTVAADLEAWRHELHADDDDPVFPQLEWAHWRSATFGPAAEAVGLPGFAPWSLRNTYVHLRLLEGITPAELGEEMSVPASEVGYPYDALAAGNEQPPVRADEVIRAAREAVSR
jgi:hypothetical protein